MEKWGEIFTDIIFSQIWLKLVLTNISTIRNVLKIMYNFSQLKKIIIILKILSGIVKNI